MVRYLSIASIFTFAGILSCVKPYEFDPQNFDKILVIEAQISDAEGPYDANISFTYPLDTVLNETVNNAILWIEDEDGTEIRYSFVENGVYQTPASFRGIVNHSYSLHVAIGEDEYISEPELLRAAPTIDTIYGQYVQKASEVNNQFSGGIQFFIDSEETEQSFFRYEWTEAYKIVTPYPASHYVLEDSSIVRMDTSLGVCYQEHFSNELIYGTRNNSTVNKMLEFPVRYVSEETQMLRTRYTILVKQFAISEAAYLFYKQIDENNESGGSLFDQQSGAVVGNITHATDPSQPVIGFFEAAGVTEKRSFFNNRDLDERFDQSSFPYYCRAIESITTIPDSAYYYIDTFGGNIYYYSTFPQEVGIQSMACTDCTFYADNTPPSYWEE